MSLIVDYLRGGGSLDDLTARWGVRVKPHPSHPTLFQLNYDQVRTDLTDPVAGPMLRECRGLILDMAAGPVVVARPFDKIFNLGEPGAAAIDWATAAVADKLDGSLLIGYHHAGRWHWATRGMADAGGSLDGGAYPTFAAWIAAVWAAQGSRFPANPDLTVLVELTGPHNRVVVDYRTSAATLLAARDRATGAYLDADALAALAAEMGCPLVRRWELRTLAEIQAAVDALDPLAAEGVVISDRSGARVKLKNLRYVQIAHLIGRASTAGFVDVIRRGERSEVLAYFPTLAGSFAALQARYSAFCAEATATFTALQGAHADQRAFALAVQADPRTKTWAPLLFALRAGKADTPQAFLATASLDLVLRLLGVREGDDLAPPAGRVAPAEAPQ